MVKIQFVIIVVPHFLRENKSVRLSQVMFESFGNIYEQFIPLFSVVSTIREQLQINNVLQYSSVAEQKQTNIGTGSNFCKNKFTNQVEIYLNGLCNSSLGYNRKGLPVLAVTIPFRLMRDCPSFDTHYWFEKVSSTKGTNRKQIIYMFSSR